MSIITIYPREIHEQKYDFKVQIDMLEGELYLLVDGKDVLLSGDQAVIVQSGISFILANKSEMEASIKCVNAEAREENKY